MDVTGRVEVPTTGNMWSADHLSLALLLDITLFCPDTLVATLDDVPKIVNVMKLELWPRVTRKEDLLLKALSFLRDLVNKKGLPDNEQL